MLRCARRHGVLGELSAQFIHGDNGVGGLVRVNAEQDEPACCRACHLASLGGLVRYADDGPAGRHTSVEAIAMLL
jgi:hypothetical protein